MASSLLSTSVSGTGLSALGRCHQCRASQNSTAGVTNVLIPFGGATGVHSQGPKANSAFGRLRSGGKGLSNLHRLSVSPDQSSQRRRFCMAQASKDQSETETLDLPKKQEEDIVSQEFVKSDEQDGGGNLQKFMWGFYAAYMAYMIFLPTGPGLAPGDPIWGMKAPAWKEVFDLSFNFMLIMTGLNSVGVHAVESPIAHPVNEGLFNFVIIWSIMLAPLIIGDKRKVGLKTKELLWLGTMFLTNVFAIPYMALRLGRPRTDFPMEEPGKGSSSFERGFAKTILKGSKVLGISGLAIGFTMIYWFFFGRADQGYGGVGERLQYLKELLTYDRVVFAFVWDIIFYSVFQAWLVLDSPQPKGKGNLARLGAIPFVGLGLYLAFQPQEAIEDKEA